MAIQEQLFNDHENHRRCQEPFKTVDEAQAAIDGFQEELYAIRNKYRIADVVFIVQSSFKNADGEELAPILLGVFGASERLEPLCAYAMGKASAMRQETVSRIMESAAATALKPAKSRK